MRPSLKSAWTNLIILTFIFAAYAIQYFVKGSIAMTPAILALFVIGGVVFKYSKDKILIDERDGEIELLGLFAGLGAVFIYFIAAGIFVTMDLDNSPIENQIFINFFCFGFLLFMAVTSLTILVMYGSEKEKPGGVFETLRETTPQQLGAAITLALVLPIIAIAMYRFPANGTTPKEIRLGVALMLIPLAPYLFFPFFMTTVGRDEHELAVVKRAKRFKYMGSALTGIAGLVAIGTLFLFKGPEAIQSNLFVLTGFCAFSVGILGFLVCLFLRFDKTTDSPDSEILREVEDER